MAYMYPYGDSQQLNLSWFLAKFKELYEYVMQIDPSGETAIDTILSRFTEQYDSTKTYIPGDYCIQDGYIYKANTTTGGTFNPNAWDAALPVNDVQGLRILLGGLSEDLTELERNAVTNTQYTPGAATTDGLLRQTKNGAAETVMTVDKEPTENSQNPVKSGAVYDELSEIKGSLKSITKSSTLQSGTDFNTLNQTAIYYIGNINNYTNAPNKLIVGYSGLLNISNPQTNIILQEFTANLGTAYRFSYDNGTTWVDWVYNEKAKKILFIGDSYALQSGDWVSVAVSKIGLNSAQYVNAAVSGTGFTVGANGSAGNGFLNQLVNAADKPSFTDVVVCGGINDSISDTKSATLSSAIETFIAHFKTQYHPMCNLHIGFIGSALNDSSVLDGRNQKRRQIALSQYIESGSPYYMTGVENAIHTSENNFISDRLHPSVAGGQAIGEAVANAILNGSADVKPILQNITLVNSNLTFNMDAQLEIQNDNSRLVLPSGFMTSAVSATTTYGLWDMNHPFSIEMEGIYFNKNVAADINLQISCNTENDPLTGGWDVLPCSFKASGNTLSFVPVVLENRAWKKYYTAGAFYCNSDMVLQFPTNYIN